MNYRITVTDNEFDNLRTLLAATSGGPWMPIPDPETENFSKFSSPSGIIFGDDILPADAAFIVAAHNELPALLARLDEVTAECTALAAVIEKALHDSGCDIDWGDVCDCWKSVAPSSVLADHDAKVRAEALREAADGLKAGHGSMVHVVHAAGYLRTRADKEENR